MMMDWAINLLTVRTCNALEAAGLVTPEQIRSASDRDLLTRKNFGRRCLDELRSKGLRPDSCESAGCVLPVGHEGLHVPYTARHPSPAIAARSATAPPRLKHWRALQDVALEREHQRQRWGDDHDDAEHGFGELASVAAHLAMPESPTAVLLASKLNAPGWALPLRASRDRRAQLVTAAALLLAEIERLDRRASR